jgi:hypothetical protein
MANSRDFTGKNRKFTGTKGITTPKGTTEQRVGSESGELRFNTTTELMEYYDGNQWKPIDAPPTISSISTSDAQGTNNILNADGSTLHTITITGGNFGIGANVKFIGNTGTEYTAGNINRVSGSSITCKTTSSMGTTDDPYDVTVINNSGLSALLEDAFSFNAAPVFANASGQLAIVFSDGSQTFSGSTINAGATDAEGNAITHTIISGSLPAGLTLASSTGFITGTVTGPPSLGNYPFVVRAATTEGTVERQFSLQVNVNPFIAATGGTVLTSGDFKTHVFTSPSSFVVANAGTPAGSTSVEYLVVAGGAGGSGGHGGGGGAGGYRQNFPSPVTGGLPVSATTYPISVGGGGNGGSGPRGAPAVLGISGGNSVFSTITSTGGGGGAYSNDDGNPNDLGQPGGSGGGGGSAGGGTGNSPPTSPPQGNPGAGGSPGGSPIYQGGGSGGAGGPGSSNGTSGPGSPISTTFFGPTAPSYGTAGPAPGRYFAGGGGGGIHNGPTPSNSTSGGGGRGGTNTPSGVRGDNGTANTGGGGGGTRGDGPRGGDGGSGIVAIRYKFQ